MFLSNPTGIGAGLGTPSHAEIKIADNDVVAPTTNPSDDPSFFVRQHYLDFLNREPDSGGLAFWVNQIVSCGSDTQCIEVKRINVSAAFFLSIEFQHVWSPTHPPGALTERLGVASAGVMREFHA